MNQQFGRALSGSGATYSANWSVQRQEGPLRHFCVSGEEALLTVAQRPSSPLVAQRGPLRHPTQQPLFATGGEGLTSPVARALSTCTARAHEWLWLPLERHSQQARTAQDSARRRLAAAARLALEARVGQLCRACNANRVVCRV